MEPPSSQKADHGEQLRDCRGEVAGTNCIPEVAPELTTRIDRSMRVGNLRLKIERNHWLEWGVGEGRVVTAHQCTRFLRIAEKKIH